MKKLFIFFFPHFLLFILTNQIFAQSLRDGFVIENSGDSIEGKIKYRAGKFASLACKFYNENGKTVEYKPGEIFGYRMKEGKYYISKQIPVEGKTRYLFAEFLIQGVANLYYVNFRNADHYYIETESSGLVELTEPERIAETENGDFVLPPKYKGKLTYVLSDYSQIQSEVEHITLNHRSLINLAKNYHNAICDSIECIIFEKKIRKLWIGYSAGAGYTLSKFNFGQLLDSDFGSGFIISASVSLNNIIVSNERFSLQLELDYQKHFKNTYFSGKKNEFGNYINYEGQRYIVNPYRDDSISSAYNLVTSLTANSVISALKIPIILNYSGLSLKYRPYFGAGFSTMIILSQNKEFIYEHFTEVYGKTFPEFLFGLKARIGIGRQLSKRQSLFFEVDYDYLMNYNINNFLRLRVNSLQFKLGFRF